MLKKKKDGYDQRFLKTNKTLVKYLNIIEKTTDDFFFF